MVFKGSITRLPLPPKKLLVKGIDQLSKAVDISMEVRKVEVSVHNGGGPHKHETSTIKGSKNRLTLMAKRFAYAIPGFLKSSALGTVMFDVYEELLSKRYKSSLSLTPVELAFTAGTIAGALHGCVYHLWDYGGSLAVQLIKGTGKAGNGFWENQKTSSLSTIPLR